MATVREQIIQDIFESPDGMWSVLDAGAKRGTQILDSLPVFNELVEEGLFEKVDVTFLIPTPDNFRVIADAAGIVKWKKNNKS